MQDKGRIAYSNKFAFNNLSENLGLLFSFIQNANYSLNVINSMFYWSFKTPLIKFYFIIMC